MPIDIPDPVLANSPSLHGLLSLHLFTVKTFVTFTNDSVGGLIDCLYDTLVEPQDVIKNNINKLSNILVITSSCILSILKKYIFFNKLIIKGPLR